jgi:hypothetical protein
MAMTKSKIEPTPNAQLRAGMREGERCEHCGLRRDEHRGQVLCVSAKGVTKSPADQLIAQGWSRVTAQPSSHQLVMIIGDDGDDQWFRAIGWIDAEGEWTDGHGNYFPGHFTILFWQPLGALPTTKPSTTWGETDYP